MILVQSLLQQLSGSKIFTLLMIFICCCNGLAQNDDISHFIIHKVKKNETLGQIAIRYNIDKDKIIEFNPHAEEIKRKDKLKIPRYKLTNLVYKSDSIPSLAHSVKSNETLYSISKKYGISLDSLKKLNPKIGDTLPIGVKLKIPEKINLIDSNNYFFYKVKPKEGFYSLQKKLGVNRSEIEKHNPSLINEVLKEGMILKIPKYLLNFDLNEESNFSDSTFLKKSIKLALLAPFRISEIELDSADQLFKTLSEKNLTTISIDFYNGMTAALDSLKNLGLSINLEVFDTKNQILEVEKLLNEIDFKSFDLIIGPFTPKNFERFAKSMAIIKKPLISPLTLNNISGSSSSFNSIPDKQILSNHISKYINEIDSLYENPCVIVIADNNNLETESKLKKQFQLAELIRPDQDFDFIKPNDIDSLLTPNRQNLVFLETDKLNLISSMTSMLNAQKRIDRQVQLITHYRSPNYDDINISKKHLGNIKFTFPSYFFEKKDSILIKFENNYSNKFGKNPNRISIKGYDLTMDVALRIAIADNFLDAINLGESKYLLHNFNYSKKHDNSFGNYSSFLVQHQQDTIVEIVPRKLHLK